MSEETNWRDSLPENVREWPEVKESDSPDKFWGQIENQRKFLGDSVRIPSQDAGDDDWAKFHDKIQSRVPSLMKTPNSDDMDNVRDVLSKLGMPEEANGYDFSETEGVTFGDTDLEFLRTTAHEAGLTKSQFKAMTKKLGELNFSMAEGAKESFDNAQKQLREQWGMAFDDRYQTAEQFAKMAGAPDALVQALGSKQIDSDTVMWLHKLSESMGEKSQMADQQNAQVNNGKLAPFEAEERLQEIYNNPNHPYHRNDPTAQKRVIELVRMAAAG